MMLKIRGLNAGYGKLVVLQDLSLEFHGERFTAILGPNGSGKSTLIKAVFGLVDVFSGSILLDDRQLIGLDGPQLNKMRLACVPQQDNVFAELGVRENLQLATRTLASKDAARALEEAEDLFPMVAKRGDQRASQLSGGERQMLAIAIGWLTQPKVMLLDEPGAGLAPNLVNEVFRTLLRLRDQGMTLVVVEQNARSILRHCDDVHILREGRLRFSGSAAECLQDEETIKTLLGTGYSGHRGLP